MSAVKVARAVAGFVLGGVLVVLMPALGIAMALVLAGVLVWARLRHEDVETLKALAPGFMGSIITL